jgi:hypothetical protein
VVVDSDPESRKKIVFTSDVPSVVEWAKVSCGITIRTIAPGDGVIYDNRDVQTQIDNLAAGVMRERALEQDRINALKEQEVRVARATAERREAEQKAAAIGILRQQQEIENSRIIAEAAAEAVKSGKAVPAGSYPLGLQSLIITPNYNSLGAAGGR